MSDIPEPPRYTYLDVPNRRLDASAGFFISRLECDPPGEIPNPNAPGTITLPGRLLVQFSGPISPERDCYLVHLTANVAGQSNPGDVFHVMTFTQKWEPKYGIWRNSSGLMGLTPTGGYSIPQIEYGPIVAIAVDWMGGKLRVNSLIP